MNSIDWDRLVIVTAITGEKFVGYLPEGTSNDDMLKVVAGLKPIELTDVRQLLGQMTPQAGPKGEIMGIRTFMALLPYDMFEGPAPRVAVIPATWYFPKDRERVKEKVVQLLQTAERNETINRAAAAGIEVAGPMPGSSNTPVHIHRK